MNGIKETLLKEQRDKATRFDDRLFVQSTFSFWNPNVAKYMLLLLLSDENCHVLKGNLSASQPSLLTFNYIHLDSLLCFA